MKIRQMELGVTHEIKIDGEKSWISYRVVADVDETENVDVAREELTDKVNAGVLDAVAETVRVVRSAT